VTKEQELGPRTRRVLVTRAAEQAGKLSEALRAAGFEPVEVPVLEIVPPTSFSALDAAILKISTYNWLILTSTNAARIVGERAAKLGVALGAADLRVAAVGHATAQAAKDVGFNVELVPEKYVAEGLIESLAMSDLGGFEGKRVLVARAAVARDLIPDALRKLGAEVEIVEAYRNQVPAGAAEKLRDAIARGIEIAVFTSSSSVRHLAEATEKAGLKWPLLGIRAVSIGPVTSQTLVDSAWKVAAEAVPSDIGGLVEAVKRVIGGY
jgi:uroporphyrinogen-III synthase/uroporphyrinogen III methyltransferase/synthase